MKNALNNQVSVLLWLVANLKQGVIYFIKQALPPNKSAGSVPARSVAGQNRVKLFLKFFWLVPVQGRKK